MANNKIQPVDLTPEQIFWGRFYLLLHREAETIRKKIAESQAIVIARTTTKKEAASESVSEAEPLAASESLSGETEQLDSNTPMKARQTV